MPLGVGIVLVNLATAAYDHHYVADSNFDGGRSIADIYDRLNG